MNCRRILAVVLCIAILMTAFAGCAEKKQYENTSLTRPTIPESTKPQGNETETKGNGSEQELKIEEPIEQTTEEPTTEGPTEQTSATETPADETPESPTETVDTTQPSERPVEPQGSGVSFPIQLSDNRLLVESAFPSSVNNPDNGDTYGDDIATLHVTNCSGEFLEAAYIKVTMRDGSILEFVVECLPDKMSVWAFDIENTQLTTADDIMSVECDVVFTLGDSILSDVLLTEGGFAQAQIRNLTGNDLHDLRISFHCLFDEGLYYGGKAYTYPIDTLAAYETTNVDVFECYLGMAEAVWAEYNN